ncbi:MAG TPA: hypothetical protein VFR29_10970 [Steroidobacteraceae bacterium]|nr:hypothetical protein [Steroidobacteraceae bacterium]
MKRRGRNQAAAFARIARRYGGGLALRKRVLITAIAVMRLRTAAEVRSLHEALCFLDAYPDDLRVRRAAQRLLRGFHARADLQRHRDALAGSGIAGTDTPFRFFWPTARWISRNWPGALVLERADPDHARAILEALPQLLGQAEAEWLRAQRHPTLAVLDLLRPEGVTDADYLIGLAAAMPCDEAGREAFFDRMDPPFLLRAGRDTPERTTARLELVPAALRPRGPDRARPDLRAEARRPPGRIRRLRAGEAQALLRLARVSMITRERDVAVFQYPDLRDAFLVDDGAGLVFAWMGIEPARRALLPALYAGLTLQNGVPIGYVQLDVLGRHAAISFNTFETFRGGEAARVFARLIAAARHAFGCEDFSVEPYQLGHANDEGIDSGAWWFYQRFGFRPRAPAARWLAAREVARRKARPSYRSPDRTLLALARSHLFYSLVPGRAARLPDADRWLAAAVAAARRFRDPDPACRQAAATQAAASRLGLDADRLGAAPRAMLARWSGLALALTASGGWSAPERRALGRLIVAKAGPAEREFQRRLLRHPRLRRLLAC